jgi:protein SCO1/2
MTTVSSSAPASRAWTAVSALAAIFVITASWWALALWPVDEATPAWFLRTREVCFGTTETGLPNAGGWLLLVGQPVGMLIVLVAGWPAELRAGLSRLLVPIAGQIVVGAAAAAIVAGLAGVVVRVAGAGVEPFSPGRTRDLAGQLTRVNQAAPAMSLIDQRGEAVTLDALRGRPVLVTFAYAHCTTVCPVIVSDVVAAGRELRDERPAVLVITLDPWRDTPSRLGPMAAAWGLDGDARVLSGEPDVVERALNAWRVPRVRNEKTGDLSHPSLVYVLDRDGRIAYVVTGGADVITAAVRAL